MSDFNENLSSNQPLPPRGLRIFEEPLELQVLGSWIIAFGAALLALGLMQQLQRLERRPC